VVGGGWVVAGTGARHRASGVYGGGRLATLVVGGVALATLLYPTSYSLICNSCLFN